LRRDTVALDAACDLAGDVEVAVRDDHVANTRSQGFGEHFSRSRTQRP